MKDFSKKRRDCFADGKVFLNIDRTWAVTYFITCARTYRTLQRETQKWSRPLRQFTKLFHFFRANPSTESKYTCSTA